MKKVKLLALAAAFVLGFSSLGNAAEMKVKGEFQASAHWTDNLNFKSGDDSDGDATSEDDFHVRQRLRTRFQFVQSETLQAVLHLEMGDTMWGNGSQTVARNSGGGLGADAVTIEVKNAYLDFNIPETLVNVKVGIQGMAFPGTVFGNQIFGDDVAGVLISSPINEMVGVTFAWARPVDLNSGGGTGTTTRTVTNPDNTQTTTVVPASTNDNAFDETDILLLAVPVTPEGMKITPWAAVALVGKNTVTDTNGAANNYLLGVTGLNMFGSNGQTATNATGLTGAQLDGALEDSTTAWWAGIAFELSMFDPFVLAMDFNYGSWESDLENVPAGAIYGQTWDQISCSGWLFDLSLKYKGLGFGTPELFFVYASGNDEDAFEDGDFGTMPAIMFNPVNSSAFAVPGGFYYGGTAFASTATAGYVADLDANVQGTWALGLALRDFSFIEKLTHSLIVMYIRGTNDDEFIERAVEAGAIDNRRMGQFLSDKDSIWEIDFNHQYKIYEQLSAVLEMGLLIPHFDEDVWNRSAAAAGSLQRTWGEDNDYAWRVSTGLIYKF